MELEKNIEEDGFGNRKDVSDPLLDPAMVYKIDITKDVGKYGSKKDFKEEQYGEIELEDALTLAGVGYYNLWYAFVLTWFLISNVIETIGYAYLLPASKCDLGISSSVRGFIGSVPFIAAVLSSQFWGYIADRTGRKRVLAISALSGGILSILAAFMPEVISFVIVKFLAAVCIACPASICYPYIGEIMPRKYRDMALTLANGAMTIGSALIPLCAWMILPLDFRTDFGYITFRPWRLLAIAYAIPVIPAALILMYGPESPKYLLAQGRSAEAFEIMRKMYAYNHGKSVHDFPATGILCSVVPAGKGKRQESEPIFKTLGKIFRPPLLKWIAVTGILSFGLFSALNGLIFWMPEVVNRVLSEQSGVTTTACNYIRTGLAESRNRTEAICIDSIAETTYKINIVSSLSTAVVAFVCGFIVNIVGKKAVLIGILFAVGSCCLGMNLVTQKYVFAAFFGGIQMCASGIGPNNAFVVQLFPTELRALAVSVVMTFGRLGSVVGANLSGLMINTSCESTFYIYAGLLYGCALLAFILPSRSP